MFARLTKWLTPCEDGLNVKNQGMRLTKIPNFKHEALIQACNTPSRT